MQIPLIEVARLAAIKCKLVEIFVDLWRRFIKPITNASAIHITLYAVLVIKLVVAAAEELVQLK